MIDRQRRRKDGQAYRGERVYKWLRETPFQSMARALREARENSERYKAEAEQAKAMRMLECGSARPVHDHTDYKRV